MTTPPLFQFDSIRRARDRCSCGYQEVSVFQQRIEQELLERLRLLTTPIRQIVILGAGDHGVIGSLLRLFPDASLTVVDLSCAMLEADRVRWQAGAAPEDHERVEFLREEMGVLSLPSASADLIFSNLYFSFCDDLTGLFGQLMRVLKTGGCLHFSTLGPDTFKELRQAWQRADNDNPFHVLEFPDMHDVGDALVHAGFCEPVMDCETYALTYSSPASMFDDLRRNTVRNYFVSRCPGLTGRMRWQFFLRALSATRIGQRYPLTLEAVLGQAWKPSGARQHQAEDGTVSVPLENLLEGLRPR